MRQEMKMWIARDSDGMLCLFYCFKPQKGKNVWSGDTHPIILNKSMFPEIKWSDSEPTEVEIIIKK